jgi:ubiquinone/menaquinone biosynthesis C-methylase UbiE
MRLILFLLRPVFYLLYHQFAWTYDGVAALVSAGHWNDWVRTALPRLSGRVLEIGYGPGHLQLAMHAAGLRPIGLDESRQMARQARRRLLRSGLRPDLTRGLAQALPFREAAFDSVVATFPAEYPAALGEIARVLAPGGEMVVVGSAWPTGSHPWARLAGLLLRLTGQGKPVQAFVPVVEARLRRAGLRVRHEIVEAPGGQVLVFVLRPERAGHQGR